METLIQNYPGSPELRLQLLQILWNFKQSSDSSQEPLHLCEEYFRYYTQQCRVSIQGSDESEPYNLRTHDNIKDIVTILKVGISLDQIHQSMRQKFPEPVGKRVEESIQNGIDLAVRLLLMVNVGRSRHGVQLTRTLEWREGSLQDFTRKHFKPEIILPQERVKLERIFTARNLERIAGIQIIWTDNLADHLQMQDDDTRVAIFHHASFLWHQKNNPQPLFEPKFINETRRTLALLFPQHNKVTRLWYRKLCPRLNLDPEAIRCGHLRAEDRHIEKFEYWHDRLVVLKQVFDESEPRTLEQWWCDRRNGVQRYTFWVAVLVLALTIFFGAVQCVEGGLQVWRGW
ncbi:hypothetical protein DL95DRAFT_428842 [Leptodontidium sp. 2 PMI_412]|nr:hypothetical protein DL95DRAFT_428842 [Leptodontidium sp. 2 PMI_412]